MFVLDSRKFLGGPPSSCKSQSHLEFVTLLSAVKNNWKDSVKMLGSLNQGQKPGPGLLSWEKNHSVSKVSLGPDHLTRQPQ